MQSKGSECQLSGCAIATCFRTSKTDFVALARDEVVGRVVAFDSGPERGLWMCSMVAAAPGVTIAPISGRAQTRREAGQCPHRRLFFVRLMHSLVNGAPDAQPGRGDPADE